MGLTNGGNETWKYKLYKLISYKKCSNCKQVLSYASFTKDVYNSDGLDSWCRECKSTKNATYYDNYKDIYHKQYLEDHRAEYNARNAKRRAQKIQATSSWANEEKIKEMYLTCPESYHVDHIYPLISDWVCGLHVENNLQHLPAKENLRKGNRDIGGVVERQTHLV